MTDNVLDAQSTTATPRRTGLRVALWIVQVLLALSFFAAGAMKLATPVDQLAESLPWVTGAMGPLVKLIGLSEVLGAIGLVVPAATRIKPGLTPLAALGLLIVMVLATIMHVSRGEFGAIGANVVLGALAAFVAWGRTSAAPVQPRA